MPRVESVKHISAQFYHSQFTNSQYLHDSSSSSASPPLSPVSVHHSPQHSHSHHSHSSSNNSTTSSAASATPTAKKKHVCGTCDRAFTTSGHLARHSRVHTGERNHKCPFPGCETRCSRQDNLQQQYVAFLFPSLPFVFFSILVPLYFVRLWVMVYLGSFGLGFAFGMLGFSDMALT